jgi:hypothetical protein
VGAPPARQIHALTITDTPDAPTVPIDATPLDGEGTEPTSVQDAPSVDVDAPADSPEIPVAPDASADASAAATDGAEPAAGEAPHASDKPAGAKRARRPANPEATGNGRDRRTTAQRLGNFPRADRPATIPSPEHHHLPGWVRRDFARARPPLSNILALLEGDVRDGYAQKINELTEGISAGRFSLAWQYPDLVDEGRALYEKQRRETADSARANRQLDTARRRVQDRLRDAGDQLAPDVAARLQRQLRSAGDSEAINAVASELDSVAGAAKTTAEKRREREIERTRARIMRSAAAAGAADAPAQTETWQDVLRRFAEQQAAGSRSSE